MSQLESERNYYRQQCNELGMRVLQLQEEQTRARREAKRSRTIATLIREVYQLAASNVSLDDIGQQFLYVILTTLNVDRVALLNYLPEQGRFVAQHTLGFPKTGLPSFTPPGPLETYYFTNSHSAPDPHLDCLRQVVGGPYLLWAYNPKAGLALLVSNSTEDQHLHRPFEEGDREIIEGALRIFIEVSERKRAENLAALSRVAFKLAEAAPHADVLEIITEELKSITGALMTGISLYDSEAKALVIKYISCSTPLLTQLNRFFGPKVIGTKLPVSAEQLERMLNQVIGEPEDLSDATLRRISKTVIQKMLGIGEFKGLALRYSNELMGTALILMPQEAPPLFAEVLEVFAYIAAVALRRKKAEEALRESETRYRTLAENFPNGAVIMFDQTLRHTIIDGTGLKELGLPKDRQGQTIGESFPPETCALLEPKYRATLAGQPSVFEMPYADLTWEVRLRPIRNETAQVVAGIVIMQNITERKQAEEALCKAKDELEMRVQERTAELAKANLALQAEITERKRAEEQLRVSLQEKEVLLKEIHHRVKNNLQIISSLLNLQAGSLQDQQALEIFRDSENRVRSMALIHEKLYRSKNLAQIDFSDYIQELAVFLFHSQNAPGRGVTLNIQANQVFLDVEIAVPSGLILNELISNALKHAFPNGRAGEIGIKFWVGNDNRLNLVVTDNGCGFPPGLDFRVTESLGLQLVNILVAQLEGAIELNSHCGTEFKITLAPVLK